MADERQKRVTKKAAKRPAARKAAPKRACQKSRCEKSSRQKSQLRRKRRRKPATKPKAEPKKPEQVAIVVRASSRYVRVAPRKARLIADQVRGLQIDKARALLQFSPRGAAQDIHKLIESAAANAENNHDLVADEMRVAEITVDEGPTLKRFRPRALGRATPIHKRTSHIAVALSPED